MSTKAEPALRDVPFKISNPERIPAKRYYDQAFFELEREHLWPHVWQMACRLEEIPEVGDWVEYRILDKSVIVVRTKSGVKAFHNACRHRGVQLASGQGNCKTQGFICPFHGWRFNMDGENTFVFGRQIFSEENLQQAELNLVPCRVETWGGCAFINFDDDAAPVVECFEPVTGYLEARNMDKLKVEWWVSSVLPTNWKLAMEAFMEGYHVMRTHPQLHNIPTPGDARMSQYGPDAGNTFPPKRAFKTNADVTDVAIKYMKVLSDGMGGMVHARDIEIAESIRDIELSSDPAEAFGQFFFKVQDEITTRLRAKGIDMPDLNHLAMNQPAPPVVFMFPHYFVLPQFGNMSSYRIRPLTPETCLFELWSLVLYPEGEERPRPVAPVPTRHDDPSYPEIPHQDYSNLPLQQLGLHAVGFEYMRLSREVEGMISNYQRTIDGFLEGRSREELTRAQQVACGGLDSPIADIGF